MIWIIGRNGQLSDALEKRFLHLNTKFVITSPDDVDVSIHNEVINFANKHKPSLIINAAAYTAVDKAEGNKELALNINYHAVKTIVETSNNLDVPLIHISTDFVFNGKSNIPYKEEDMCDPINVYGNSKLLGDNYILDNCKSALILRVSWLYNSYSSNFLTTMQKLGKDRDTINVIYDQVGTPTYVENLVDAIIKIIPQMNSNVSIVYNYSNEGVASWYDFAHEIMTLSNIECEVRPIKSEEYPTDAQRPFYTVLDKSKIKNKFHIAIPHWRDALKTCISQQEK